MLNFQCLNFSDFITYKLPIEKVKRKTFFKNNFISNFFFGWFYVVVAV